MKTAHPIGVALLLAWSLAVFVPRAEAEVIVSDAAIVSNPDLQLVLTKSLFQKLGLFAISIEARSSSQYLFGSLGIAERYAMYAVNYGTTIDPAFVVSATPIVSNDNHPGSSLVEFTPGESKYFAYWDDRAMFNPTQSHSGDLYGWALITRTASGLEVTSSATAIGDGIIVGTTTQVPEPSAALLATLGIVLALGRRGSAR